MNTEVLASTLAAALPAHLAGQRWYGGKGRGLPSVDIISVDELAPPWPALVRVVVDGGGAGSGRYQLVLGLRPVHDRALQQLDSRAAVCSVTVDGQAARCFDALADPELSLVLLHRVAPGEVATTARPVGAEQSNSSVVYDERIILKLFRRPESPNPEIEMTEAVNRVGFGQVPAPIAVWRERGEDLALVQRFLAGGIDGWTMALASARAAEGDGEITADAAALGHTTAALHVALADAFGATPGTPGVWAEAASSRIGAVDHAGIDRAAARAAIDAARGLVDGGNAIRIHGDYHLGQVMRTADGWFVLDFEGEPSRPLDERRAPSSPLRDVAGMLRSFGYAAGVACREVSARSADGLATWERRARDAFLAAYFARLRGSPLLPSSPRATQVLLDLFELDKAVYEIGYEQGNRPDWVDIPVAGVRAVLGRRAAS